MHQHLLRLTPFRFIAALFVVAFHFGRNVPPFNDGWLHTAAIHGHLAVSFFYCLSGFVMATVYNAPMNGSEKVKYWLSRLARIYPVYLLCLVVCACVWGAKPLQALLSALLLQSWVPGYPIAVNAPGWSLSVEVLFYALFPLMTPLLTQKNLLRTAIAALILWLATQWLTFYLLKFHYDGFPSKSHDFVFYFPLMHLNEFVLGAVAGAAFHLKRSRALPAIAVCFGAALAVLSVQSIAPQLGLSATGENGLYAPIFLAAIWMLASMPRAGILDHWFATTLGEASYAMYLLQIPVMLWFGQYVHENSLLYRLSNAEHFYFCLVVLILTSIAVHFWIERPARSFIKNAAENRSLRLQQAIM